MVGTAGKAPGVTAAEAGTKAQDSVAAAEDKDWTEARAAKGGATGEGIEREGLEAAAEAGPEKTADVVKVGKGAPSGEAEMEADAIVADETGPEVTLAATEGEERSIRLEEGFSPESDSSSGGSGTRLASRVAGGLIFFRHFSPAAGKDGDEDEEI